MGEFTAGDVIVPVVPSAKGFITDLKKQILPAAVRVGTEVGESIMRGIQARIRPVTVQATADTSAAGTALEAVRQQAARLTWPQARKVLGPVHGPDFGWIMREYGLPAPRWGADETP